MNTVIVSWGDVKFSALAKPGTVISRRYVTPQELCLGAPKCSFRRVIARQKGGDDPPAVGVALFPTNVSGISTQLLMDGKPQGTDNSAGVSIVLVEVSSIMEIQLVRDSRSFVAGPLRSNGSVWDLFPVGKGDGPNDRYLIDWQGSVSAIAGTCKVPGQVVKLPPAFAPDFSGPGTTSGKRAFDIQLENCPAGLNRVGHALTAIGGEVPGFPGALKPTAGSTATGVAIKLTDAGGAPAVFDRSLPVTSYNKATGGSATVPMHASYVQTGATVKPGSVKGAVQVLLDYQ